ncbi:toxin-antitoxin system YwqK family antitoxin [Bacteroidota bacterium]
MIRKKLHTLFVFTLIAVIISGCSKTKQEYWDNGNIKSEIEYQNDEMHGKAKWYFYEGGLQFEVNYIKGKLDGPSTRYFSNGKIQSIENYKDDQLNGKSTDYIITGKISEEKNFVNDTLEGEYKLWYANGIIQIEGYYNKGLYDGKWIYRDTYGNIVGIGDFKKGSGTQTGYNSLGNIIRRVNYKNNKKEGKEYYYDNTGELVKVIVYEGDEPIKVIDP